MWFSQCEQTDIHTDRHAGGMLITILHYWQGCGGRRSNTGFTL